jgi:hypothetical protein
MKPTLASAIAAFGALAKEKLANPVAEGQPEDQLRAPLESLVKDLAEACGLPRERGADRGGQPGRPQDAARLRRHRAWCPRRVHRVESTRQGRRPETLQGPSPALPLDVNVNNYATYLSVACGEAGLLIFDLVNKEKPQLTGTTEGIQVTSILKGPGIADNVTDGMRVMYLDTSNPSKVS